MSVDEALEDLAGWIHGARPTVELLDRVAAIGREVLPGTDEVSVVLVATPHDTTIGSTSDVGRQLDERQRQLGRGPCLDAAYGGTPVLVEDLANDSRWPDYSPTAVRLGIRSSLSAPLPAQEHVVGAIDWYAGEAGAYAADQQDEAAWYAARVAVLVTNSHLFGTVQRMAADMQVAMQSRAVIEQAKGVIMATARCDADTAFRLLVEQSQHQNRKLREIAEEIVARHAG